MKKYLIYKITNLFNNKIYVGKHITTNIFDNYMGSSKIVLHALKKYGKLNFKKDILEHCKDSQELNDREKFWIKKLNSRDKKIGYNIGIGGEGFGEHNKSGFLKKGRVLTLPFELC